LNAVIEVKGITQGNQSSAESIELDRARRRKLAAEKQFYEIMIRIEKRIQNYGT